MIRRRRLRATENLRALVRETSVSVSDLIYPLFVIEGNDIKNPIDSMPGIYQYSLDRIDEELDRIREAGVKGVLLFGIPVPLLIPMLISPLRTTDGKMKLDSSSESATFTRTL